MTTGERVKEIRKSQKLTLKEFGERLGVGKGSISAIENDNRNLTSQMSKAICREFGVNENWLRTGSGEPYAQKTRAQAITEYVGQIVTGKRSETEMLLIELMSETSPEEWKALSRFFDRLAEKEQKSVPYAGKQADPKTD